MDNPKVYVREGNTIVEKEAPIIEHKCWWCKNPFMYELRKPGIYIEEIVWYCCPNCLAMEDRLGLNFMAGEEERRINNG